MRRIVLSILALSLLPVLLAIYLPPKPEAREYGPPHNRKLRETECNGGEYEYNGRCCRMCPAGKYVDSHCMIDHTEGRCSPCTSGYAAGPNGLQECQRCSVCRTDEEMVTQCTPTSNTVCQCKKGTYCHPGDPCEICTRCTRCRAGQRVKEECTATRDTVCESIPGMTPTSKQTTSPPSTITPPTGITEKVEPGREKDDTYLTPFIAMVVVLALIISFGFVALIWCWYRGHPGGNGETCCPTNSQESLFKVNGQPSASSSSCPTPQMDRNGSQETNSVPEKEALLQNVNEVILSNERLLGAQPSNAGDQPRDLEAFEEAKDPKDDDDGGGGGGTECPVQTACSNCNMSPLCECQWTECIYTILKHLRTTDIFPLVRLLNVKDNTIDYITSDHLKNTREQNYQLLYQWRVQMGRAASIKTILRKLEDMNLAGCKENIINTLRNKRIPII